MTVSSDDSKKLPVKQSVGSQITLGVLGNYVYDNLKSGLPLLISYLIGQMAYLKGLDWYWILISATVIFFLISISLHLITLIQANKRGNMRVTLPVPPEENITKVVAELEENHRQEIERLEAENLKKLEDAEVLYKTDSEYQDDIHQTTLRQKKDGFERQIQALSAEHRKETEKLKSLYTEEIESLKKSQNIFLKLEREHEGILLRKSWLFELEKNQQENIDHYVLLKRFFWYSEKRQPTPGMYVGIEIENKSLFDVTFDDEIKGYIEFDSLELRDKPIRFYGHPDVIPSSGSRTLTIEYGLSNEEINYIETIRVNDFDWIKEGKPLTNFFNVGQLILTIKGISELQEIKVKNLVIDNKTKVINGDIYSESENRFK